MKYQELVDNFPHPEMRENQKFAFEQIVANPNGVLLELPTGSGKTAVGITYLKQFGFDKGLFYVTTNRSLVNQVGEMFPEAKRIYGRSEYPCLHYPGKSADDVPCYLIGRRCIHRPIIEKKGQKPLGGYKKLLDMGDRVWYIQKGVTPCPYYNAKIEAMKGGIVACTYAFYTLNCYYRRGITAPKAVVFDEVHKISEYVRRVLSFNISERYLNRGIKALKAAGSEENVEKLVEIRDNIVRLAQVKPPNELLNELEVQSFINLFNSVNTDEIKKVVRIAINRGLLDEREDMKTIKTIEKIAVSIPNYIKQLQFALPGVKRNPLNYVVFYYDRDKEKRKNIKLQKKSHYVSPFIQRLLLPDNVIGYSATIGGMKGQDAFRLDTGFGADDYPIYTAVESPFPIENTKIYLPSDNYNLAMNARKPNDLKNTLRRIGEGCLEYLNHGMRSLVVVVSNNEISLFKSLFDGDLILSPMGMV
jgi:Rad3-related DNA helicase